MSDMAYRYELRRGEHVVATGHLTRQHSLEVGDQITIGGQPGIVRSIVLPRVSEAWLHGERWTKKGLPPREGTVITLVLDPPWRGGDLGDWEVLLESVGEYCPSADPRHLLGFANLRVFHERKRHPREGRRRRCSDLRARP